MMIRFLYLWLALELVFCARGCTITPFVPSEDTGDWGDAGSPDDCSAACDNLSELGCEGAEGSPGPDEEFGTADDVACAEVCRSVMEEGEVTMHPSCVAAATSCDEADACFNL
jgi:hypothetical protein